MPSPSSPSRFSVPLLAGAALAVLLSGCVTVNHEEGARRNVKASSEAYMGCVGRSFATTMENNEIPAAKVIEASLNACNKELKTYAEYWAKKHTTEQKVVWTDESDDERFGRNRSLELRKFAASMLREAAGNLGKGK